MIDGIILAAGASSRFGENKLEVMLNNKPVITSVLEAVAQSELDNSILVYHDDVIKNYAAPFKKLKCIYNPNAKQGMSTSVICGIKACEKPEAYVFINGDQPLLTAEFINNLLHHYREKKQSILVPRYNKKRGTPTIFQRKWRSQLLAVKGDKGGREIIKNNPEEVFYLDIENQYVGMDIDTKEDYLILKEWLNHEK